VINTNLCTAVAMLVWIAWDYAFKDKPSLIGSVNGMITGLVAITPSAGFITGWSAIAVGVIASTLVWFAIRFLSRAPVFRNVDDTLGVIYTHGIAGLTGGLLVGVFANAKVIEYIGVGGASDLPGKNGVIHGSWTLLRWQAEAGAWVIVFSGIMTFILLKIVGIFMPLRLSDEELEIGDHAIHGNEVYPSDVPTLGGPHAPAWQPGGGGAVPAGAGA
jgi:Amt family ammonium transporter